MHDLKFQLGKMARRMTSQAFSARNTRWYNFSVIGDKVAGPGSRNLSIYSMKPEHAEAFVDYWNEESDHA